MVALGFPKAFQHYRPRSQKVFGVICISLEKRFLLVRGRKTGKWSFPKGHLKGGETSYECALREMYEETGIRLGIKDSMVPKKLYAGEYFVYELESETPISVQDNNEILEAGWFSLQEFQDFSCNADIMNFINKYQRGSIEIP